MKLSTSSSADPAVPRFEVVTFVVLGSVGLHNRDTGGADTATAAQRHRYDEWVTTIALHGGYQVTRPGEGQQDGHGESLAAAFALPTAAVAAALDLQRAWTDRAPTEQGCVGLRAALHTGPAAAGAGGRIPGPTIERAMRLRAIAHGGQILLSDPTREHVGVALPDGATLRDLGTHRLKDLGRPERVWQLCQAGQADAFPPLRSLGALPTNLPFALSNFLGRRTEIDELVTAIGRQRLITLTGAGGCGKTRLALQAGAEALDGRVDGVWLVELAAASQDQDVARAVARVFGLREEPGRPLTDTLAQELHALDALLVLDNCEQVLVGCASLASQLLQAAPKLRILATSRELLGIEGERTWRVPSLDSATGSALFIERSRWVRPGFEPDAADVLTIGRLVDRLDGLPLAIELAAARTRMMQPARILESLDDRFRLLTGGSRQKLPRQQTLEASVAWSYDLLDVDEQILAMRLSVLHSFDLETAEAVGSGTTVDAYAVLELLTRLVDKSLVLAEHADGDTRYRFLETVRQFLRTRLLASGEAHAVRQRQLAHFLGLAEQLAPRLPLGDGPRCLARLQSEHDNLDDALVWAESTQARVEMLRLVTALSLFYELRGHLAHGGRWFARALALPGADDARADVLRARALWGAAHVAFYGGHFERAAASASNALALAQCVGDTWAEARALNTLGVLQSLATPVQARESLARSIELGRSIGDEWAVADGWKMTTVSWYVQHDDAGARPSMAELRRVGEALGSRFFLAWHQAMVGYFARDHGDYELAGNAFTLALAHCRFVGDPSTGGFAECWSAALDADLGRFDIARQRLQRLLATAAATGSELALPECLFAMANLAVAHGDAAQAAELLEPQIEPTCAAGVPSLAAQLLLTLGAARRLLGELAAAAAALARAAEQSAPLQNAFLDASIQFQRGLLARAAGDDSRAEDHLHAALAVQVGAGLRPGVICTLEALAALASSGDSHAESARILCVAAGLRMLIGRVRGPLEQAAHDALVARLREQLGEAEFMAQWVSADSLGMAEIVEYVSRARGQRKRPLSGWASLTPTELRVVALVAEGLSNPQIGERMFIARGTAKIHVAHIFDKLGVTSRSQLAAMATARGIDAQRA